MLKIRAKKVGLRPGEAIFVGEQKMEQPRLSRISYTRQELRVETSVSQEQLREPAPEGAIRWINLDGVHDTPLVSAIGELFDLHPLLIEDILNTHHRPKLEEYRDVILVILQMLTIEQTTGRITTEQVSLILGKGFVLTFQEREGDVFSGVRTRLENAEGRLRRRGADYLAYALLDSLVDSYFLVLEQLGDRLEQLEELAVNPTRDLLSDIHQIKRELLLVRRAVWPLREICSSLLKDETGLIDERTEIFLRDVFDHTVQLIDTVEIFRDSAGSLLDLYLSVLSHRMNEVMKVLTVMASLFIPVTFIAGVYGMNFDHIPELHWKYGYFGVWGVMLACVAGMLVFFRLRKWF